MRNAAPALLRPILTILVFSVPAACADVKPTMRPTVAPGPPRPTQGAPANASAEPVRKEPAPTCEWSMYGEQMGWRLAGFRDDGDDGEPEIDDYSPPWEEKVRCCVLTHNAAAGCVASRACGTGCCRISRSEPVAAMVIDLFDASGNTSSSYATPMGPWVGRGVCE